MRTAFASWILVLLVGCGGSDAESEASAAYDGYSGGYATASTGGEVMAAEVSADSNRSYEPSYAPPAPAPEEASYASGDVAEPMARYAQATPGQPPPPPQQQTPPPQRQQTQATATDATTGPLLVYEAWITLAVYEVEEKQTAIVTGVRDLGGYVAQQNANSLVVRIPAGKFEEAVALVEGTGDVLARNIQATEVGEQFRDLTIRIQNAEAIRDRLEQLLARAQTVEEALAVEQQLERVTLMLEQLKGQLRALDDRIAYSTITIAFQPQATESLSQPDIVQLPFGWLDQLGLSTLLNLR